MDFDLKNLFLDDILVPEAFVAEYIYKLSADALRLYLTHLLHRKNDSLISIEETASIVINGGEEQKKVLSELWINGLIRNDEESGKYQLVNLKLRECESYIEHVYGDYKPININDDNILGDNERLIDDLSNTFMHGVMGAKWTHFVLDCINEYKFENEVIYMLFSECSRRGSLNLPYVRAVASNWYKEGVRSGDDLEEYSKRYESLNILASDISRNLKIKLTEAHLNLLKKWLYEDEFDRELILKAMETSIQNPNLNFNYFDAVLQRWKKEGLDTSEKVARYQNTYKSRKKKLNSEIVAGKSSSFAGSKRKRLGEASKNFNSRDFSESDIEDINKKADTLPIFRRKEN